MWFALVFISLFINNVIATTPNPTPDPLISIINSLNENQLLLLSIENLQKIPQNECTEDFKSLAFGLANSQDWALRMIDASAKPQSGILMGNIMHVGNYDECLEIKEKGFSGGKYCSAFFRPHPKYGKVINDVLENLMGDFDRSDDEQDITGKARLSYGFCVPKVCTAKMLQNITNSLEESLESPFHFIFDDEFCDGGDGRPFTKAAIFAIVVFSIFAVLLVCATLYDVFIYQRLPESEKKLNLLIAFSMYTNAQKILSTKTAEGNLTCLNGLRVVSLMWIVLAHGFQSMFFFPHINGQKILEWKNQTENAFVAASSMAVDTFFVISGLLVVYLFLKSQAKGVKFNIPMFYLHRILRLTPSLAMVVLLTSTLLNYMGNGPFWAVVDELYQKPCEKNWWSTLIYFQNYINPNEQCTGQAWYLAVDTQMYFLSPIVLFPLVRWPKQTLGAVILFIVLNCSYVFEITWKKHLGTTFFDQGVDQFNYLYSPTHVRGTSYLIGMVCGYFVYKTRTDRPLKLSNTKVTLLWLWALAIMLGIVLGHSSMISAPEYNVLDSSFFNALTRVGWSIALSIIILLCVNGYGGAINAFLSSDIFTVLIRLNYSVYLIHLNVLIIVVAQGRTPTYFSNLQGFHQFWGDYCFTVAVGFFWTLAFESPVITIEKIIFGKKPKTVSKVAEAPVGVEIHKNLNNVNLTIHQDENK